MHAVNAYAERTVALLLAEGIEHDGHVAPARALGARLGQGSHFGRPVASLASALPLADIDLPRVTGGRADGASPFACLPDSVSLRRSTKPLLVEVSKHLERETLRRYR